ncbi:hypothetical protein [Staphylococcus massiliensis]|uniref:Uncharacterized protein n=1 Tax=Staphylococcus massiliensis S46 TaxID=1229783 RepID=K9AVM0_9STAP|nr:hypothetical protein [Staphylococcus massiliensis]EKU50166.1 hypothetical protein C273_00940 [Staphylococcus massiliensis S46]MCG3399091.1 hypothetical protein [Staphylococcus massiliensis]MCG3400911.1 hypothetical protein [Staphylococcus massiliensis]MCG3412448.1 hypothetical protein [Staphylococcus massiliensis]
MSEDKAQQSNEQAKAQNLFAKWRQDEVLYKEDEEKDNKESDDNDNDKEA